MIRRVFTSESVTEGHPDKMCDQISDAVLDAIISQDIYARVACECITTTGMVFIMGEITTDCYVDFAAVARKTIKEIGYDNPNYGFDYKTCAVFSAIDEQSPDIDMGVSHSEEYKQNNEKDDADIIGAGDQGMMFGYACDETPELMPASIVFSHKLARKLADVRKRGELSWLRPDGKTQVTVQYNENGEVERIPAIVISTQHSPDIDINELREGIIECVLKPTIDPRLIDNKTKFYVNPTGRFVVGGPMGDSGLTGRKIIVDTYGGAGAHGGGCFSGKDPTKVDRSASYMARYVAKSIVAAGLARKCQIEVAYAIGVARPVSIMVETFGTGKIDDKLLSCMVERVFDFRPAKIIEKLDLRRPIYRDTAVYGHFGRSELDLSWERTDMADAVLSELSMSIRI